MNGPAQQGELGWLWKMVAGGVAAVASAALFELLHVPSKNPVVAVRVLLTIGGVLALAVAIMHHPRHVGLLVLASATCMLAQFGLPQEWDSIRIVAVFGGLVAAGGAVLVALPVKYRKAAASALILLHFGNSVAAVTAPDRQPWLSSVIGMGLYRPYTQFMYLGNAHHFYSPEPGPASQVWFCIKYKPDSKGELTSRWIKLPRRPEDMTDPLALSYYRRLSLTQNMEQVVPAYITEDMKRRRAIMEGGEYGIPFHPEITPVDAQYRFPTSHVRNELLPSYVRHVYEMPAARHDDRNVAIDTIKVYLVVHNVLGPRELKFGMRPYDDNTYSPYYMGEFNKSGQLIDANDPLLYWLIPIFSVPKDYRTLPPDATPRTHPNEFRILDGVERHTKTKHNQK